MNAKTGTGNRRTESESDEGRGTRGTPRQKHKRSEGGRDKTTVVEHIRRLFKLAAQIVTGSETGYLRPERREGPMSHGELYEYYKRAGLLEVFFGLFPGG